MVERLWWYRHWFSRWAMDVEVGHESMVDETAATATLILRRPRNLLDQGQLAHELKKTYPNIRCRVGKTGLLVKVGIS